MKEYKRIVDAKRNSPQFKDELETQEDDNLVYQYRNFQSFWQILKSDSLWATNARFSNDEAEQQFGKELISSLCKGKDIIIDEGALNDNYIICFCKENDKLSQWRGYASEGGVSMGFDFSAPRAFSVLNSDILVGEDDIYLKSNQCVMQYVDLNEVRYISSKKKEQSDEDYMKNCRKTLMLDIPINDDAESVVYREEIIKKSPYIKHSGFIEENECRLVFRNTEGELNNCIRYRNSDNDSLKYPYIVIKTVLPSKKEKNCLIRVCLEKNEEDMVKSIKDKLLKKYPRVLVEGCHYNSETTKEMKESFCRGCTMRCMGSYVNSVKCRYNYGVDNIEYEYTLPDKTNCIVISMGKNQEEICNSIHELLEENSINNTDKISVWCEGHLPLRKITVGPCVNQSSMIEAIQHYCKHVYWLRDVEILASDIPFRKSL